MSSIIVLLIGATNFDGLSTEKPQVDKKDRQFKTKHGRVGQT